MIPVREAIDIAVRQASPLGAEAVSLTEATGYVLCEDIYSDIDMPPFDKSSMDGYALRARDVQNAPTTLAVVGFIPAGVYPEFTIEAGQAAKIMTGAPLPLGSDSVQMVEKTGSEGDGQVKILEPVSVGKHVARKGEVMAKNSKVLSKGHYISPAVAGVLATVGKKEVAVFKRPQVGILITGNELVEVDQKPQKGQIRNSNGYALLNQVQETGCSANFLGIVGDDLKSLREMIALGLRYDVLLITGGVSMGELDLVEDVFEELGVQVFYDKVNIKPGKPTVFGRKDKTLVFGLPGNPVSASTIFDVVVRPVLRRIAGFQTVQSIIVKAELTEDFQSKTCRENYAPAQTHVTTNRMQVSPIHSRGSADVLAYAKSNSYLIVPGEVDGMSQGDEVEVLPREEFWRAGRTL